MNICFFGVGGVGGYFGALVANEFKDQHNIYFVARGKHKDAINENGLTLKKSGGESVINVKPDKCTDSVNELPPCDVVVLSVKSYDLDNAAIELTKIVREYTVVLPLLNGVDISERIKKHLKKGIILRSCVYVGTHIESPGVIFQKGGSCKILFGPDIDRPTANIEPLLEILDDASISYSQERNVDIAIWSKFMFIAAYGMITATYNKTIGEILEDEKLAETTKAIMKEIHEIAKVSFIPLPEDIIEQSFAKAREFPFDTKTSFQRDVESKGQTNEGSLFGGAIIQLGKEMYKPTPVTERVYNEFQRSIGE